MNPETPFENADDKYEDLTVKRLREILNTLPSKYDNFPVSFDGACGRVVVGDFTIYRNAISING
jgi:hypothetical protein